MPDEKSDGQDKYLGPLKKIVVIGAAGVGKSCLVNALLDETTKNVKKKWGPGYNWRDVPGNEKLEAPKSGVSARGVTKECSNYYVYIGDKHIQLVDSPGIGDSTRSIQDIIQMLNEHVFGADIEGILNVTLSCERFGLANQFVTQIFKKLMPSGKGWESLIVVGTKKDKNDEEELEEWSESFLSIMNKKLSGEEQARVLKENLVTVACKKKGKYDLSDLTSRLYLLKLDSFNVVNPSADDIWDAMCAAGFEIKHKSMVLTFCKRIGIGALAARAATLSGISAGAAATAYSATAAATGGLSLLATAGGVACAYAADKLGYNEE